MTAAWPEKAACSGMSVFLDFTADKPDAYSEAAALRVCSYCAVRGDCLAAAIGDPDASGVYGGQVLRRPRKTIDIPRPEATRQDCGSRPGYRAHGRNHEVPRGPCLEAEAAYQREWKRKRGEAS